VTLRRLVALASLLALACGDGPAARRDARVRAALERVRFVAYTPRGFEPGTGAPPVREDALRADLALLRPSFSGLITYSAAEGLDAVPRVARELGFRAVIVGVWSPTDAAELALALAAARAEPDTVLALALGNEGLFFHRYDAPALAAAFARARAAAPELPLAVSEPFSVYLDHPESLPEADLWLPNVHPIDQPWFGKGPPEASVDFVASVAAQLAEQASLPVLVKETGLPSGPTSDGFSELAQAHFWGTLATRLPRTRDHAYAWFEAFDSPWKPAHALEAPPGKREREAYFGLFRADGSAKPALEEVR